MHTYYVLAGDTPILVHNCGNGDGPGHLVGEGDDPLVPQLVEDINSRYPGHVRAQGIVGWIGCEEVDRAADHRAAEQSGHAEGDRGPIAWLGYLRGT
ncbi:hypothetical protein [Amycolatopsis sp. MEPSY49]|uniref:hypothetical protein n=1 Tax=Amycolatopsis sp. MEPSY49 TaxID=3151600 RepID=UPI003F51224C